MIGSVVSCPNPPLLLPGLTGGPVAEVEKLREACLSAVTELLATGPDAIRLIGGLGAAEPHPETPLSLEVGRMLLAQAGCTVRVEDIVVDAAASTEECLDLGRTIQRAELETAGLYTGLLVMADGSARRSVKAPGYLDERAAPFDALVETALEQGDPAALAALDSAVAGQLLVGGRAAWQVLAGATEGRRFAATLYYSDGPFGVWYPVAGWHQG